MKVRSFAVLLILALGVQGLGLVDTSHAQSTDVRIGYVDLQKALAESRAGKSAQKEYEKAVAQEQTDIDKQKSEFDRLREALERQSASLNEDALGQRQEELLQKERDIKRSFKDSQENLRRKNAKMVQDLLRDLQKAVASVGEERGFTVILERGGQAVLYADNKIDITDEVVKRFDNDFRSQ